MTREELMSSIDPKDPFDHHTPTETQAKKMTATRLKFKAQRDHLLTLSPSRERSLAITALEESLMWANKAIALH
jgi:hypothetical protein